MILYHVELHGREDVSEDVSVGDHGNNEEGEGDGGGSRLKTHSFL